MLRILNHPQNKLKKQFRVKKKQHKNTNNKNRQKISYLYDCMWLVEIANSSNVDFYIASLLIVNDLFFIFVVTLLYLAESEREKLIFFVSLSVFVYLYLALRDFHFFLRDTLHFCLIVSIANEKFEARLSAFLNIFDFFYCLWISRWIVFFGQLKINNNFNTPKNK